MPLSNPRDPREFFSRHHQAYVESPRHARGHDLEALVAGLKPRAGEAALDVATGGGHTALKLAEQGVRVTALDITREMLDDTVKRAAARGLTVSAAEAYAESLPFAAASFDIVTCRRAAHHFRDIQAFLTESYRVLKPGGRLAISDMTATAGGVDWLNRLERLRDPSHHRAWSFDAWYEGVLAAGFHHIMVELTEEPMEFQDWLAPVAPDSREGTAALELLNTPGAPVEFVRGQTLIKRRLLLWGER